MSIVYETQLSGLPLLHRGKVRDVYAIDDDALLIVTSDRLSAFDVVLPDPIPGKGEVLNRISNHWFARTGSIIGNHLLDRPLAEVVPDAAERAPLEGRSVVAQRLHALPIEAVVRGYLIGSGWKDYRPPARCAASGCRRASRSRSGCRSRSLHQRQGGHRRSRREHRFRYGRRARGTRPRGARA